MRAVVLIFNGTISIENMIMGNNVSPGNTDVAQLFDYGF